MGQSRTASPPTEEVNLGDSPNTVIGVTDAWLNTVIGLNNGKRTFKYKFSCRQERQRFQERVRAMDRFSFDFDVYLNYITLKLGESNR